MSKAKKVTSKKVVKTSDRRAKSTSSRSRSSQKKENPFPLLYNRQNYLYMLIGVGLIALGLLLMIGGSMPSPDVWDESLIYSFRRTVLAPIVIIAGLAVEIYAIFK